MYLLSSSTICLTNATTVCTLSLGLFQWSDKVIRRATRLWDISGQRMVRHEVYLLVTPRVVVRLLLMFGPKQLLNPAPAGLSSLLLSAALSILCPCAHAKPNASAVASLPLLSVLCVSHPG